MPVSIENSRKFLEALRRFDLSRLLAHSEVRTEVDPDYFYDRLIIVVSARAPFDEALRALPYQDRKRIAQAVLSDQPEGSGDHVGELPEDFCVERMSGPIIDGLAALLADLIIQREMMIAVATTGLKIQEVDDFYIAREHRLREVAAAAGAPYTNPHDNLWDWYRHWSANFSTYAERRKYVGDLFQPAIAWAASRSTLPIIEREPTGWERVDRALAKARQQVESATAEEDFQAIGLLCREVIISLAQAVYDQTIHGSTDGVTPSPTDANRMLEAYVAHVFPGVSYKEIRAHARASLALALNLQHRRTATRQLAALCVEAAGSTTALIAIIAGRVDA